MATDGSVKRPGKPASTVTRAGRLRNGPGKVAPMSDNETKKCPVSVEGQSGGNSRTHRSRRAPAKRDSEAPRELFVSPALVSKELSTPSSKHKGVLSDSENEEPISRRIRNISSFIRKTKNSAAFTGSSQRSQSCTDSVERGGKLKTVPMSTLTDRVGVSHCVAAGILLSSENSRSVSAPITAPDRRFPWRAIVTSSVTSQQSPAQLCVVTAPRPERSISPDSNDSISEELNHFKPIVCSPCTPPRRLPDGALQETTIVKSTPRNLTRGLQKATSYEASPAVLQKWRQIELDRLNLKTTANSKSTSVTTGTASQSSDQHKRHISSTATANANANAKTQSVNKRKLLFEPPDADALHTQSVNKIRVPAIRYSSSEAATATTTAAAAAFKTNSRGFDSTVESCSGKGAAIFSRKQSFSPYAKRSGGGGGGGGFQACKLAPNNRSSRSSQSPNNECDGSSNTHTLRSTSRSSRGQKKQQKTKHLDDDSSSEKKRESSESKRSRSAGGGEASDERLLLARQDRALARRLQRRFDSEMNPNANANQLNRGSPDTSYHLRSWMANHKRCRRGLRWSRRINKKH